MIRKVMRNMPPVIASDIVEKPGDEDDGNKGTKKVMTVKTKNRRPANWSSIISLDFDS